MPVCRNTDMKMAIHRARAEENQTSLFHTSSELLLNTSLGPTSSNSDPEV
jgi:hypothetical protein